MRSRAFLEAQVGRQQTETLLEFKASVDELSRLCASRSEDEALIQQINEQLLQQEPSVLARLLMAPTTPRVWHCRTVAERRAAAYSAFEEAFKEYAPRPGLAAEREFAAHAAAFSACQSACSAEARALAAAQL